MRDSVNSRELIAIAKAGDRDALERLLLDAYDRVSGHISRKLRGQLATLLTVDDIIQETFIDAIRCIADCEARTQHSFSAWLCAIADHRLMDIEKGFRRKKRGGDRVVLHGLSPKLNSSAVVPLKSLSDGGATPAGLVATREAIDAVRAGIAQLPRVQREVVNLHHIEGRTLDETAALLGRSPGAVRGMLYRAKRALRTTMQRSSQWFDSK